MDRLACKISGVEKAFGMNRVLRGIDLDLPRGTVTALMGANGAGKSTLVKILCGAHQFDAGQITLNDRPWRPEAPSDAIRAGIVTVHQSINDGVVLDLDVASNLMLDRFAQPKSGLWARDRRLRVEAAKVAEAVGVRVPMTARVRDLPLAERQLIAIARAMSQTPSVLILDEPTSSLSATEAERLFGLIDRLRETGVAILYISHRMSDIRRIADRIVSMRDGQISGVFEESPLDLEGAVTAMLGHAMTDVDVDARAGGDPILRLEGLQLRLESKPISLTAHQGEVIAVTGLVGSGKSDLASVLFGLEQPASGHMVLNERAYRPTSSAQSIASGVFLCARDRGSNGIVPDFNLAKNLTLPFLPRYTRGSFLSRKSETAKMQAMVEQFGIVCQGPGDAITDLSGGNQQKVMVARWMAEDCSLLILDEPFQGVDIKARRDICHQLRASADARATIVFVAELDEALEVADRIVVMADHTITGDHMNRNADLNVILSQITGQEKVPA